METLPTASLTRREWAIVLAIAAGALALRIAMGQGALWLDEAWSAMHARDAATPIGVFLGINHDNNHHLNSLWMQMVGIDAPPVVQRGLAIVTGTATVIVAAVLGRRDSWPTALTAAAIFAVSPFFAHYGSEARGYAPMMLALLMVLLRTQAWLDGAPRPTTGLALWGLIGMLSQLTMAVALVAVAGWAFLELVRRESVRSALFETTRTFAPAAIACAMTLGGILLAAKINSGEMRFGAYVPYTGRDQIRALLSITGYTIAVPRGAFWPAILLMVILAFATVRRGPRIGFYWLALIAFPLAVAILQPGNPGHARYYSLMAVAIALMLSDVTGALIAAGGWRRLTALAGLVVLIGTGLFEDARLIRNQRGDPGRAITAMQRVAPDGTSILVDRRSAVPVVAAASLVNHYPLRITRQDCSGAPFLFIDRYDDETFPDRERRCGRTYVPYATLHAVGMTNFHWRLYRLR
ncbi:hypothetical protein [uncultured Sphingomonas sp.]|uniref:hypothetical protein n=1 Tax=uncultured Sphingomonas sp. TaxID=158754 RepID=UPI0025F962E7|nr:hypothetical protein [uncultured Sphingomonas sp.]